MSSALFFPTRNWMTCTEQFQAHTYQRDIQPCTTWEQDMQFPIIVVGAFSSSLPKKGREKWVTECRSSFKINWWRRVELKKNQSNMCCNILCTIIWLQCYERIKIDLFQPVSNTGSLSVLLGLVCLVPFLTEFFLPRKNKLLQYWQVFIKETGFVFDLFPCQTIVKDKAICKAVRGPWKSLYPQL